VCVCVCVRVCVCVCVCACVTSMAVGRARNTQPAQALVNAQKNTHTHGNAPAGMRRQWPSRQSSLRTRPCCHGTPGTQWSQTGAAPWPGCVRVCVWLMAGCGGGVAWCGVWSVTWCRAVCCVCLWGSADRHNTHEQSTPTPHTQPQHNTTQHNTTQQSATSLHRSQSTGHTWKAYGTKNEIVKLSSQNGPCEGMTLTVTGAVISTLCSSV
jgi:hypothetical protein